MLCRSAKSAGGRNLGLGIAAVAGTVGDSPELQEARLVGTCVRGREGPSSSEEGGLTAGRHPSRAEQGLHGLMCRSGV